MPDAVNLELFIGPAVPLPVSKDVIDAIASVKVTASSKGPSAFELTFNLSTRSPLHTLFLIAGGASVPIVRVVVAVTMNGRRQVLIDGVMTHHEVGRGSRPGTVVADDHRRGSHPGDGPHRLQRHSLSGDAGFRRVALILAKYSFLGVIPR